MRRNSQLRLLPLALVVLVAACGPTVRAPAAGPGAPAPAEAVDRFLRLAVDQQTTDRYIQMGWIFGNERGPIVRRDPASDVERRMYAISRVLEHEGFELRPQRPVPGRVGNAIQIDVDLTQRGQEFTVPFIVVRGPAQRWYIEEVRLEAITGRQ
jgi:hypothetical protein